MITSAKRSSGRKYAGTPGSTNDLQTTGGLLYNVRAPATYTAQRAWPAIVFYPGATEDRNSFEKQCGITKKALAAGYIIAFSDHVDPTQPMGVNEEGSIPHEMAQRWRVGRGRMHLGGNSDGASGLSENLLSGVDHPAAVVLNAVGTSASWLAGQRKPAPLSVMLVHGSLDTTFPVPEYGIQVADWWASCDSCQPTASAADKQGFQSYSGCAAGLEVLYNQPSVEHGVWPKSLNDAILAFFGRHGGAPAKVTR